MKLKLLRVLASCAVLIAMGRAAKAADLAIEWNRSDDPSTRGYVIDYGVQSGRYTHEVDVGNALRLTIDTVNAGATYYFVVRSYDAAGVRGSVSGELTATAARRARPTITGLTITSQVAPPRPANTTIQWTATPVGGVAPYQYRWFAFDGETWWTIGSWTTAATVAWQPAAVNDGYVFGVWARSAGSTTDAPEVSVLQPFRIAEDLPAGAMPPAITSLTPINVAAAPIARTDPFRIASVVTPSPRPTRNVWGRTHLGIGTVTFVANARMLATARIVPFAPAGDAK